MSDRKMQFHPDDAKWLGTPPSGITPIQVNWLTREGSLTAHLRSLGAFTVQITREEESLPYPDEYVALALPLHQLSWTREVLLLVDGIPFVFAHTVTPITASLSSWSAVRYLNHRPLGDLLYCDSEVIRSPLVSTRITSQHPLYREAKRALHQELPPEVLSRRSIFERKGSPLLITECMLPALWGHLKSVEHCSEASSLNSY